jgi:hypothetical protein
MFKATSKKDSLAGPSNTAGEVKQHDKAKGKENSSGGPYEHRLNLSVSPLPARPVGCDVYAVYPSLMRIATTGLPS